MAIEMRFDLTLSFSKKAQIPFVAKQSRGNTNRQRAQVPERIQQARATTQFGNSPLSPGQMFCFFLGSLTQCISYLRITRGQGLPLIQRLGTNLATMIDPHQANDMATLCRVECTVRNVASGNGSRGTRRSSKSAQSTVKLKKQGVDGH